jgi:hypothetical protein
MKDWVNPEAVVDDTTRWLNDFEERIEWSKCSIVDISAEDGLVFQKRSPLRRFKI